MEVQANDQQAVGSPILRLMSAIREKRRRRSSCPPPSASSSSVTECSSDLVLVSSATVTEQRRSSRKQLARRASAPSDSVSPLPNSLSCPAKLEVVVSGGKVVTRRRPSTVSSCPVTPRKPALTIPEHDESLSRTTRRTVSASTASSLSAAKRAALPASTTPELSSLSHPRFADLSKGDRRSYSLTELDQRRAAADQQAKLESVAVKSPRLAAMPLRRSEELPSLPTSSNEAQIADGRFILAGSQRPNCPIRFPLRCVASPLPDRGMRQLSVC